MGDMLVKLYDLPPLEPALSDLRSRGVEVRRALAYEKRAVAHWVGQQFSATWASECDVAFSRVPVSCFVALQRAPTPDAPGLGYPDVAERLLGFACYEATCRNYFGPEGVASASRGLGIGKGLLLACLHALAAEGYAYAIIGWAGPVEFYRSTVGAIPIEGSEPGIFRAPLAPE